MNLPNRLTLLRIFLAFLFMAFFPLPGFWAKIISFAIFILAAISDYFDGRIAYKRNMVTDFGKLMDPIADKILVLAVFIAFVQMRLVKDWMVMVIISRELLITSLRLFALNKGRVLSASKAGKHKTFSQMVVIFLILGFIVFQEGMKTFSTWNPIWESIFRQGVDIVMWFIVGLTLYSGVSYLWENRKIIANI
ncbi:CDP-diacylglycerol--glycerol-3-phosphate 3-phosphatidyltransferase [bacterium]|nr:MAG: CDP-diacylglycerol--glycerol-3-phosphate 3-phosphatidyltransferase [bacterium]